MERDDQATEEQPNDPGWPIGFIVLVVAGALYLGLRLVQSIGWVIDRLG